MHVSVAKLSHEVSEKEERIVELRHALTMLDQDHDQLVREANKKDETIANLSTQLDQKGTRLGEKEDRLVQLCGELERVEGSCKEREGQMSQAHGELDSTRSELLTTRQQLNALTQQIGELRSDLSTMTQVRASVYACNIA